VLTICGRFKVSKYDLLNFLGAGRAVGGGG
jgi:hypothetical protein